MDEKTFTTVVKVLADKVSLLEWQLERAEEEAAKLRKQHAELTEERDKLREDCASLISKLCAECNTSVALNVALEDEARNEVGI